MQPTECLSQITSVKIRKASLLSKTEGRILWIGYGEGRCIADWEFNDGFDPFKENSRLLLSENPFDICTYSSHRSFVSTDKGSIFIVNTKEKGEFHLIKKISEVHRNCDSRKLSHYDKTLYSGSSNGSIVTIDMETAEKLRYFNTGYAGVRSLTTLSGGSLLASGHASGQLLIWDTRDASKKPAISTPSKCQLDGVTALATHPAQTNVIAFGTDNGAIGFSDIRGANAAILPVAYELSSSTINDVKFHPNNGDHLVCCSADGSIVNWDATHVRSYSFSGLSKESPWLSDKLREVGKLNIIKGYAFSSINSIDISGDLVIAASDMMTILAYPSLKFSLTATS